MAPAARGEGDSGPFSIAFRASSPKLALADRSLNFAGLAFVRERSQIL